MNTVQLQIREKIIFECLPKDLPIKDILFGCDLAQIYFKQGKSFNASVQFGIAVANSD